MMGSHNAAVPTPPSQCRPGCPSATQPHAVQPAGVAEADSRPRLCSSPTSAVSPHSASTPSLGTSGNATSTQPPCAVRTGPQSHTATAATVLPRLASSSSSPSPFVSAPRASSTLGENTADTRVTWRQLERVPAVTATRPTIAPSPAASGARTGHTSSSAPTTAPVPAPHRPATPQSGALSSSDVGGSKPAESAQDAQATEQTEYLRRVQLPLIMDTLISDLTHAKPDDPVEYTLQWLKAQRESLDEP